MRRIIPLVKTQASIFSYRQRAGRAALFVAANLPPGLGLQLRKLFGAVGAIPIGPGSGVGGEAFAGDFLERQERPVAHLRSGGRIADKLDEPRNQAHPLGTTEIAAIGNIAAGAVADGERRIVREGLEEIVEDFVLAEITHAFHSPL